MDRGTRAFWLLIVALLGTSGYFAWHIEARRGCAAPAPAAQGSSD